MLQTEDKTRKTYINIVGGRFAVRCDSTTTGAVKRFSEKKKEDVYELLYDSLTMNIKSIKIEKNDFGKSLVVESSDGELLTIPVESKYFDSFCSKIGSADLTRNIKIVPFSFEKEGKKYTGVNIWQQGEKLPYYFTAENPKGKPFSGAEKLDESDWKIFKLNERKFFCNFIESLTSTPF